MKKRSDWVMIILILIFSGLIFGVLYKYLNKRNSTEIINNSLVDSVSFLNFKEAYLTQLFYMGNWENNRSHSFDSILVYEQHDEEKRSPLPLTYLFNNKKRNMIIRYTEIGCNSCADSTFKVIKKYTKFNTLYNIVVLVDFSNYDAYLKWAKVSEINYPVYWLKKGSLPFKIESENSSYIFTVNVLPEVDNFFVPNSRFSEYIENYFFSLEASL